MTPIWVFPAYPLLVAGPLAANFLIALSAEGTTRINSVAIALYAVSLQGAGFMVSLMIYAAFIYRLMTHKLPEEPLRAGMVCLALTNI
jgi:tellurite resistance protein TehA-like permease